MTHRIITAEEARALREAATPGPWGVTRQPHGWDVCLVAAAPDLAATVEALHAEVERLRALVADAYSEGYKRADLDVGWAGAQRIAECWADSESRAALEAAP